ncbi:hypothetical protein TgHK011_009709 [Trichoderma gracile]|nr:hypothetical protein TgHK011_009709 [Trichoderma gracile]
MMPCSALLCCAHTAKLSQRLEPQLLRVRYRVMGGRLLCVPRTWSTAPGCSSCKVWMLHWQLRLASYGGPVLYCRYDMRPGGTKQPGDKTIQPALSQRVSGPPCRAPAVTALLPNRKTEQRLRAHRCSVGRRTVGGCCAGERGSAAPSRGACCDGAMHRRAAGRQHPQRLQHRASPPAAHRRWLQSSRLSPHSPSAGTCTSSMYAVAAVASPLASSIHLSIRPSSLLIATWPEPVPDFALTNRLGASSSRSPIAPQLAPSYLPAASAARLRLCPDSPSSCDQKARAPIVSTP